MDADSDNKKGAKRKLPPHLWKKGQSGNPGGRKAVNYDLVAMCRSFTAEAIQTLHSIMIDESAREQARVKAAEVLLDRGWGTSPQTLNIAGDLTIKRVILEDGSA